MGSPCQCTQCSRLQPQKGQETETGKGCRSELGELGTWCLPDRSPQRRVDGGKTVGIVGVSDVIQNFRHRDATPDSPQ